MAQLMKSVVLTALIIGPIASIDKIQLFLQENSTVNELLMLIGTGLLFVLVAFVIVKLVGKKITRAKNPPSATK